MEARSERLSALDRSFLDWETSTAHMHVACVMVFEPGTLRTATGGVDFAAFQKAVVSALARVPRYRQRLERIPVIGGEVWVDDDRFSLDYHLRHTALPQPGSEAQLQELAAWIMQQPLDRTRPLWEMWVVEGLAGGRFAVVSKVHHCMVDGIAGMELMQSLLSPTADPAVAAPLARPRPAPSGIELVARELLRRVSLPRKMFGLATPAVWREFGGDVTNQARTLLESLVRVARPATRTRWSGPIGPHRRFEWLAMELDSVRALGRHFQVTVNDVVLATVAGAVRRALVRDGFDPARVRFRVLAPVSVRTDAARGMLGNQVSLWVVDLPVGTRSARRRLSRIHEQTSELKRTKTALGAKLLADVAEWTSSALLSIGARAATKLPAFNAIVTNVPGPQIPLYLGGARLREAYPVAPLIENIALNVALMSYDGRLFWGLNADYDRVPDLTLLREDLAESFAEIEGAASRRELRKEPIPASASAMRGSRRPPAACGLRCDRRSGGTDWPRGLEPSARHSDGSPRAGSRAGATIASSSSSTGPSRSPAV